jgi:hypothetical protein
MTSAVQNIRNIGIVRRNKAVKLIQKAWRDAYYNPNFKACKTRLRREFCTFEKELSSLQK